MSKTLKFPQSQPQPQGLPPIQVIEIFPKHPDDPTKEIPFCPVIEPITNMMQAQASPSGLAVPQPTMMLIAMRVYLPCRHARCEHYLEGKCGLTGQLIKGPDQLKAPETPQ